MLSIAEIVTRGVAGDRRWLARAITLTELRKPEVSLALSALPVRRRGCAGAPHVVGLTGPPGAGKSTLADRLVREARAQGLRAAVVAVDPSSPFSGGAILGDRVRMDAHTGDDGVFLRSLSSRGQLGGLSVATAEVVELLDAAGFDFILVETVGVGQSELAVMEVADTSIVVLTPESGDTVQTMKAGLLEIADIFVVNKADRPGARRLADDLERSVDLSPNAWRVPVHQASALAGSGLEAVWASAKAHLAWCAGDGAERWRQRRGDAWVRQYLDLAAERARAEARARLSPELEARLRNRSISPAMALR